MSYLFHHLVSVQARQRPEHCALIQKETSINYLQLERQVQQAATGLLSLEMEPLARVAIYLPKQPETITSLFATSLSGGCFVPINPVLKPPQVRHILTDSNARVLITNRARAQQLLTELGHCNDLRWLILVDADSVDEPAPCQLLHWADLINRSHGTPYRSSTDSDMAAILYTSGSTGKPKGVVLSHRNLMVGAQSVSSYIGNQEQDRILAVLPLSFDAGLSQVTTAFSSGACCVLLDYLLPNDVMKQVVKHRITGITAVPPLWHQIANLKWTPEAAQWIRRRPYAAEPARQATHHFYRCKTIFDVRSD